MFALKNELEEAKLNMTDLTEYIVELNYKIAELEQENEIIKTANRLLKEGREGMCRRLAERDQYIEELQQELEQEKKLLNILQDDYSNKCKELEKSNDIHAGDMVTISELQQELEKYARIPYCDKCQERLKDVFEGGK
jgi:predicted RNase H-like nuclease (RuvC/YqgF family)